MAGEADLTDDQLAKRRRIRETLVRDEVLRIRIAAWGLQVFAVGLLGYAIFLVAVPEAVQPRWEFLALLAFAGFCVAAPLVAKLNLSKDGGGFDLNSPIDLIDRLEAKAQAARAESFEQTRQQIGGLSQKVQELSDALVARDAATPPQAQKAADEAPLEPTLRQIQELLPPVTDVDDQQKGRFGGAERGEHHVLSARYLPSDLGKTWGRVILTLSSTDRRRPLDGAFAYFFLHETFNPDAYRVKTPPNSTEVSFEITAMGAFTAGVVAERGQVRLEIDLATSPNFDAPKDWRER